MRLPDFLSWRDSRDQVARQLATKAIVAKATESAAEQQFDSWAGSIDPMAPEFREYEELGNARDEARIAAEDARHALARYLSPRDYAKKGYPGRSAERFLARAEREARMHPVRPDKMHPRTC